MNMKTDLFNIEKHLKKPATGKILISEPFVNDFFFTRSVVLLTEHGSEGSFGYILNKKSNIKLHELIPGINIDAEVLYGGPVDTDIVSFIHNLGHIFNSSVKITNSLFWKGNFDHLKELINKGKVSKRNVKFFLGYCGWEAGQLENELRKNYWIVNKLPDKIIMSKNINIWEKAIESVGGKYKLWKNAPVNPQLN